MRFVRLSQELIPIRPLGQSPWIGLKFRSSLRDWIMGQRDLLRTEGRNGYWGGLLAGVFGLPSTLLTPVFVACAVLWYPVSVPDFVLS